MTALTIHRLRATVHATVDSERDDARRADRMLHRLATGGIDRRLAHVSMPDGEWCLRRVDLTLPIDPDASDAAIEEQWAAAVLASIEHGVRDATPGVVHYRRRAHALHDLVSSLAAGRTERLWAWRQLGIAVPFDPDPVTDPRGAVIAAIERAPQQAVAAIGAAVRIAGPARVHRLLAESGWMHVARVAAAAAGATTRDAAGLLATRDTTDAVPRSRAEQLLAGAPLARALVEGGLRPSAATARSWAVLALAEADGASLAGSRAGTHLGAVCDVIAERAGDHWHGLVATTSATGPTVRRTIRPPAGPPEDPPSTGDERRAPAARATGAPTIGDAPPERDAPASVASEADEPPFDGAELRHVASTAWGGLLFLLGSAADAGIPVELVEDERLAARPVRWVLHQLGLRLVEIADDDPALRALSGLSPDAPPPAGGPPDDAEGEALAAWAERWTTATVSRLGVDVDAVARPAVLAGIARRRADVAAEPGWIEMHLDLADVDVDVRRAGLDLDPGWVPWLGVVVRFVYE